MLETQRFVVQKANAALMPATKRLNGSLIPNTYFMPNHICKRQSGNRPQACYRWSQPGIKQGAIDLISSKKISKMRTKM